VLIDDPDDPRVADYRAAVRDRASCLFLCEGRFVVSRLLAAPRFRGPSAADDDEPAVSAPGALPADLARDVGRMVHARLAGLAIDGGTDASREVDRLLALFAQSPLAARLAAARVLGREVPMLLEEDGARWHGAIDLLLRDADGTIVVADFKTDSDDSGAAKRHAEQLRIYTRAVRRAMPGSTVRAELWMLRSGRILPVDWEEKGSVPFSEKEDTLPTLPTDTRRRKLF